MSQIQNIPLFQIHTEGLQVRAETDRAYVDELTELFGEDGQWPAALPPVTVFHDGADYYLADGHHRYQGAQEAGCESVPCEVRQGDRTAALWYAISTNSDHGLRRTKEDKRRAVLMAYRLDPSLSDNAIAKRCRVSQPFVSNLLKDHRQAASTYNGYKSEQPKPTAAPVGDDALLSESDSGREQLPGEQLAEPTTSTPSAVTLAALPPSATDTTKPAPDYRVDANGRRMNVANIGRSRKADKPATAKAEGAPNGRDELDLIIPSEAGAEAFHSLDFFEELDIHLAQAAKMIDKLGKMPGAELLRSNELKLQKETRNGEQLERLHSPDLDNLRRSLKHWRPYAAVCPHCKGEPKASCKVCLGLPYVIRSAWEVVPEKLRNAVATTAAPAG